MRLSEKNEHIMGGCFLGEIFLRKIEVFSQGRNEHGLKVARQESPYPFVILAPTHATEETLMPNEMCFSAILGVFSHTKIEMWFHPNHL